ncbi:PTS transporter subunit EIIC [Enterococcus thailandicus]|uniref:PTS transporter subunit EIIC n=1 Tax=Enterococcus thailandicus TaxID=417368 RepID=UPI0022E7FAEE|nr:PTS transporter subunit EIIC [Enterococcus thailandicus]
MNKLVDTLEKYLVPLAVKLENEKHLSAIKNGFVRIMPLTLVGAIFILINSVFLNWGEGSFFYSLGFRLDQNTIDLITKFKEPGIIVQNGTIGIMSLLTPFAIAKAMAEQRKVDGYAAGVLSIGAFVALLPQVDGNIANTFLGGAQIFAGIILGLIVGEIFAFIVNHNWIITLPDSVPSNVAKSFSALIPGVVIFLIAGLLGTFLSMHGTSYPELIMEVISKPLSASGEFVGWFVIILSPLLWFFGIHGPNALGGIVHGVLDPFSLENMDLYTKYGSVEAAKAAGEHFHLWTKTALDAYLGLGGTATILGLLIAILIFSKREDYRAIGKLGIAPAIFNISEPVMFGLPIVMNPLYFIPFVFVQPILALVVTIAYNIGFLPPTTAVIPWVSPVGFGAFFATNGSLRAVLIAIICLALSVLIYAPFVIVANREKAKEDKLAAAQEKVSEKD